MGSGITVTCKTCREEESFWLGIGMMYSDLKNVITNVHYTRRDVVLKILDEHDVSKTKFEHRLFYCQKCHRLYERFYVKILYDSSELYESIFKCNKCKRVLSPVDDLERIKGIPCSKCGKISLDYVEDLNWD